MFKFATAWTPIPLVPFRCSVERARARECAGVRAGLFVQSSFEGFSFESLLVKPTPPVSLTVYVAVLILKPRPNIQPSISAVSRFPVFLRGVECSHQKAQFISSRGFSRVKPSLGRSRFR